MDDCSLEQSVDDLALPNRRLAVKLAVDQHDRRVSVEEPTIDVAAARRRTKLGCYQRCSLGPLQARPKKYERWRHRCRCTPLRAVARG
jgi:hypothetical protein